MSLRARIAAFIAGFGAIGASIGLGIWGAAVEAPCMRPYAECAANGHLGEMWGGLLLFILAAAAAFVGLVLLLVALIPRKKGARR